MRERITSDESKAKTIISYFNESDTTSEKKKKTVITVSDFVPTARTSCHWGPYGIFNYDHLSEFNNYSSKPTFPSLHLNIS